ncbi:MAG: tRNA (N6-threonylcarbamoyladenosine(37)-N6)-methyltransferase TrmO [Candidatus Accumulibacter sp.]|nr:tRNA (N6-threonylcarbamoyladenosine(37)-N6)-methyltransferase TrmO [Accumulibacter sp.]
MADYRLSPIGYLATPFADRFAIPRQPRLVPHALGRLRLLPAYARPEAVRGLQDFSHVWLQFIFHRGTERWHPTVRPPRLGGNRRVGVFASRSPYRPNPLGLSLVELLEVDTRDGVQLVFGGVDLLDGTPIVDIKPYLPFIESEPMARSGFVDGPPPALTVEFSPAAERQLTDCRRRWPELAELLREVLAQDPRPAYADDPDRLYGCRLHDLEIKWRCLGRRAIVEALSPA